MPCWVPLPSLWGYLTGAVLLVAGLALAVNRKPRTAAASIGALIAILTVLPYCDRDPRSHPPAVNEALNYVADTWLYAGAALALASALPPDPDRVAK